MCLDNRQDTYDICITHGMCPHSLPRELPREGAELGGALYKITNITY